ncbi:MAG: hypothetical protein ABH864_02715 [archaeon]
MNPHEMFAKQVTRYFASHGYDVETEVPLPDGKGALDVLARSTRAAVDRLFACEVKSSPASPNCGRVGKQMGRYMAAFGNARYLLVSPRGNELFVHDVESGDFGPLRGLL